MNFALPMGDQIVIDANIVLIENRKKEFAKKFGEAQFKEQAPVNEDDFMIDRDEPKANNATFDKVEYNRLKMLEEHNRRFYNPAPRPQPIQPLRDNLPPIALRVNNLLNRRAPLDDDMIPAFRDPQGLHGLLAERIGGANLLFPERPERDMFGMMNNRFPRANLFLVNRDRIMNPPRRNSLDFGQHAQRINNDFMFRNNFRDNGMVQNPNFDRE